MPVAQSNIKLYVLNSESLRQHSSQARELQELFTVGEQELENFARLGPGLVDLKNYFNKSAVVEVNGKPAGFLMFSSRKFPVKELEFEDYFLRKEVRTNRAVLSIEQNVVDFFLNRAIQMGYANIRGDWMMPKGKRVFDGMVRRIQQRARTDPKIAEFLKRIEVGYTRRRKRFDAIFYTNMKVLRQGLETLGPKLSVDNLLHDPNPQKMLQLEKALGKERIAEIKKNPELLRDYLKTRDGRRLLAQVLKIERGNLEDVLIRFNLPEKRQSWFSRIVEKRLPGYKIKRRLLPK